MQDRYVHWILSVLMVLASCQAVAADLVDAKPGAHGNTEDCEFGHA